MRLLHWPLYLLLSCSLGGRIGSTRGVAYILLPFPSQLFLILGYYYRRFLFPLPPLAGIDPMLVEPLIEDLIDLRVGDWEALVIPVQVDAQQKGYGLIDGQHDLRWLPRPELGVVRQELCDPDLDQMPAGVILGADLHGVVDVEGHRQTGHSPDVLHPDPPVDGVDDAAGVQGLRKEVLVAGAGTGDEIEMTGVSLWRASQTLTEYGGEG